METYQLDPVEGMVQIENVAQEQETEMADLTTPISELIGEEPDVKVVQQPTLSLGGGGAPSKSSSKKRSGLTPEQMDAIIAGVAAIAAFSKPIQNKIADMIPGDGLTNMLASALVAAIIFFFAKRFLAKRQ